MHFMHPEACLACGRSSSWAGRPQPLKKPVDLVYFLSWEAEASGGGAVKVPRDLAGRPQPGVELLHGPSGKEWRSTIMFTRSSPHRL